MPYAKIKFSVRIQDSLKDEGLLSVSAEIDELLSMNRYLQQLLSGTVHTPAILTVIFLFRIFA